MQYPPFGAQIGFSRGWRGLATAKIPPPLVPPPLQMHTPNALYKKVWRPNDALFEDLWPNDALFDDFWPSDAFFYGLCERRAQTLTKTPRYVVSLGPASRYLGRATRYLMSLDARARLQRRGRRVEKWRRRARAAAATTAAYNVGKTPPIQTKLPPRQLLLQRSLRPQVRNDKILQPKPRGLVSRQDFVAAMKSQ